jgi:predicted NBD/HSP70 family sugar kinase
MRRHDGLDRRGPTRPRRQVLRALRDLGPQPRVTLARRLDLSPTTVTKVVAQLLDEGVVAEAGAAESRLRVGRPPTHVALVPTAAYVLGVQIGVGHVHIGLCDLVGRPYHTTSIAFDSNDPDPAPVLRATTTQLGAFVTRAGAGSERILAVGVVVPGPVDRHRRRTLMAINLGWRDVAISEHLETVLGVPTVVDHSVRAMALAEARHGGHRDADPLLYVYVRAGVGAGIVIDGEPFRPGTYGVLELGHMRVDDDGPPCVCGAHGCLETVVSEPRLLHRLRRLGDRTDPPLAHLSARVEAGEPYARIVADDLVEHLSTGLACAANLLNPRIIVLGGMFDDAPHTIIGRIEAALHRKVFPVLRDDIRVTRSMLGPNAGISGAATVALDRYFYS